jgi:4-hydroxy-2-oxoheptanedioate aldolase
MTEFTFKKKLAEKDAKLTAHFCSIPSPMVTQTIAAAGSDAVIIDFEHGPIDQASAHAMIAATAGTSCAPLVRVTQNDHVEVKRALDLGAEGILFPMTKNAEDAKRAVASVHYPPVGVRGFGPFMAQSRWQKNLSDYKEMADGNVACCLLVETKEGVENINEICAVPGIDLIIPARFDLSTDLGVSGQFNHPKVIAAITRIEKVANKAGIPLGNVAMTKDYVDELFAKGYKVICGYDVLWLGEKAAEAQNWAK